MFIVINGIANVLENQLQLLPHTNKSYNHQLNKSYLSESQLALLNPHGPAYLAVTRFHEQLNAGVVADEDCQEAMKVADPSVKAACAVGGAVAGAVFGAGCLVASGGFGAPACLLLGAAIGGAGACGAIDFKQVCGEDDSAKRQHNEVMAKLTEIIGAIEGLDQNIARLSDQLFLQNINPSILTIKTAVEQFEDMMVSLKQTPSTKPSQPTIDSFKHTGKDLRDAMGRIRVFIKDGLHGRTLYDEKTVHCTSSKTYEYLMSVIAEAGFVLALYDIMVYGKSDTIAFERLLEINYKNYWKCASILISIQYWDPLTSYNPNTRGQFAHIEAYGGQHDGKHLRSWINGCPVGTTTPYCRWQLIHSHVKDHYIIMSSGSNLGAEAWGGHHNGADVRLWAGCNARPAPDSCLWKIVKSQLWGSIIVGRKQDGWNIQSYNKNLWWFWYEPIAQFKDGYVKLSNIRDSPYTQSVLFLDYQSFLDGTYSLWD